MQHSGWVDVGGIRIFVQERGEGIPLLFIHPPLLTSTNFYHQWVSLSQHFRIILFDIRGHGQSEASTTPISYGLIVQDMERILDALGIDQVFCCGYSTGTSIALEFALTRSERCRGIVLLCGMSGVYDRGLRQLIQLATRMADSPLFSVLAASIAWGNHDSPWIFKRFFYEARRGDQKNIAQYYGYSLFYDCFARLKEVGCPTLLLCGGKDGRYQRYGELLHREIPHSMLMVIPEAKHQLPTKWAAETNRAIIQFIKNSEANGE